MISNIIYFLSLLVVATGSKEVTVFENKVNITTASDENVLCRSCGFHIFSSVDIISKVSPASQYTVHDTLFNRKDVLIQVLLNYFFLQFPVITSRAANCVGIGEWEYSDVWFPGFRWKPCICPECGAYIGWLFVPNKPSESSNSFFSLILTNIVGESFIESLTVYPGLSQD